MVGLVTPIPEVTASATILPLPNLARTPALLISTPLEVPCAVTTSGLIVEDPTLWISNKCPVPVFPVVSKNDQRLSVDVFPLCVNELKLVPIARARLPLGLLIALHNTEP